MLTENHLTFSTQRSALSAAEQPHGTSAPRQACDADSAYSMLHLHLHAWNGASRSTSRMSASTTAKPKHVMRSLASSARSPQDGAVPAFGHIVDMGA